MVQFPGRAWPRRLSVAMKMYMSAFFFDKGLKLSPGIDIVLYGRAERRDTLINSCVTFRQIRDVRELFLDQLLLNYLQLKIILMPTWHVLGWHILLPFS